MRVGNRKDRKSTLQLIGKLWATRTHFLWERLEDCVAQPRNCSTREVRRLRYLCCDFHLSVAEDYPGDRWLTTFSAQLVPRLSMLPRLENAQRQRESPKCSLTGASGLFQKQAYWEAMDRVTDSIFSNLGKHLFLPRAF